MTRVESYKWEFRRKCSGSSSTPTMLWITVICRDFQYRMRLKTAVRQKAFGYAIRTLRARAPHRWNSNAYQANLICSSGFLLDESSRYFWITVAHLSTLACMCTRVAWRINLLVIYQLVQHESLLTNPTFLASILTSSAAHFPFIGNFPHVWCFVSIIQLVHDVEKMAT